MGGLSGQILACELCPGALQSPDGAGIVGPYVDEALLGAVSSTALPLDAVFHAVLLQQKPHPNTPQPRHPLAQQGPWSTDSSEQQIKKTDLMWTLVCLLFNVLGITMI